MAAPDVAPASTGARGPAALAALLVGAALLFAGFTALGLWQWQRLAWKEALIARVERRLHEAPVAAPGRGAWPALQRDADEYRRVRVHGRWAHELETTVRASTELGSGWWVLTPLQSDDGSWLLVNRGFVPPEQRARETRAGSEPQGGQEVVGLLRFSEPGGSLLQHNAPAEGRWYSRDVAAIAAARGLGSTLHPGAVAPYFIDAAAMDATAATAWPRPGLTVLQFPNHHLQYALTWFALAAMVVVAAVVVLREEWQGRTRGRARTEETAVASGRG